MATISVSLPSDGQTIDAADYNTPINTIVTALNGNLDSDNINEGGVVPNSLVDGTGTSWAWQDWTPTLSGITEGNGTVTAKYVQIGKTVVAYFRFVFGSSGSAMSTGVVTLPVTASANYTVAKNDLGGCVFDDAGTNYHGRIRLESTTTVRPIVSNAASTYVTGAGISSSVPMAWASGDILSWTIVYEAA